MIGFRRGLLRQWGWLAALVVAGAMVLLGGKVGGLIGLFALAVRAVQAPPRHSAIVYFPKSTATANATPCLWLDTQRIVLGAPYRLIYRDEVTAVEFARLRRLCRGLPS